MTFLGQREHLVNVVVLIVESSGYQIFPYTSIQTSLDGRIMSFEYLSYN